jgi:ribosomal protein S12 methylthiotransferase accessory factor
MLQEWIQAVIHIVESGRIAAAVYAGLKTHQAVANAKWFSSPFRPGTDDLIIASIDGCSVEFMEYWERTAHAYETQLLCIHVHGAEAIIGPEINPHRSGCFHCWLGRYYSGRKKALQFARMPSLFGGPPAEDPWLTPLSASVIGHLTAVRVAEMLTFQPQTSNESHRTAYLWNMQTSTVRQWVWFPDSCCSRCSNLPIDSAEAAVLKITRRLKSCATSDRIRKPSEFDADIQHRFVSRSGLASKISTAWRFTRGAVAVLDIPLFDSDEPETCSGFSDTYRTARTVAALEALERYAGLRPSSRQPAIYASVASLGGLVVDPKCFGLHSKQQYQDKGSSLTPYDEHLKMNFVWAYSVRREQPVLIPEQLGFYSLVRKDEPTFLVEGSNGCAIGSCPEEAILHSIFEVVERDAFLLTWYAKRKPPHFDLMEAHHPEIRHRCRRLSADGFECIALDITNDFGIPAVWLMARNRATELPYAVCVGGAHLRVEKAVLKALRELDAMLDRYLLELKKPDIRNRIAVLAADFTQVRTMNDHGLLYCAPESGRHLEFLIESTKRTSLEMMEHSSRQMWSADLGEEVREVLKRILHTADDVVLVNQTSLEQSAYSLFTYKALVTGAVPINWGYGFNRLEGISRLRNALTEMGLASPNPMPHPFC